MKCYSENCKGGRTHLQLCAVFINAAKRMPSLCKMNCQYLQYPLIRYKTLSVLGTTDTRHPKQTNGRKKFLPIYSYHASGIDDEAAAVGRLHAAQCDPHACTCEHEALEKCHGTRCYSHVDSTALERLLLFYEKGLTCDGKLDTLFLQV